MRKRNLSNKYEYGPVLQKESQVFKADIYKRIGLRRLFLRKKILDLGCGYGTDSIILAKFARRVVGVDIIKYKEWTLFSDKKIKFIKADSAKLPFSDNTFDGVYLKDLLHHVRGGVGPVLDEIKRVTKPSGEIVILEANRYNPVLFIYATKLRGHDHFTQNEFKRLIASNFLNFRYVFLEAYPPFRFPMKIFKLILKIESKINNLHFLSPFFTYNIAVIKNVKSPKKK